MECEQKIERPECDSSATSSIIAPTSDDFPDLSAEMLTAVTKRALLAIPLTFPGDSIFDTDVVHHYAKLASVGHDQYPSGKAGVCDALSDLGMSAQRVSIIAENFETLGKCYELATVDELWDLYPPELLMFWSLQSAFHKARWAASRRDHQGGEEEGGGSGRDHQGGGTKGRSRKGRKKMTKPKRDTKFGRFPRDNERFFASAKDYMKADSQYADWDHISVEYPESDEEALAQEHEADLEDADLADDDLGEDDLGDDDLGDDDLGDDDLGDTDEAWWDIKWNSKTRTVYHGMPITEYRQLMKAGRWSGRPCRDRGELAPCPAVYFATNKAFALFFAAFKAGLSSDCLNTSVGVVIETPLPPCRYALIRPKFREDFSRLNRNEDNPIPPRSIIVSGLLQRWRKKYKENTELADVLRLSHQLAVVMPEDKPPMEAIINSMPSKVAIVGFSTADVECESA
jgi:hypothetical protein